jgi:hypothetical protein
MTALVLCHLPETAPSPQPRAELSSEPESDCQTMQVSA